MNTSEEQAIAEAAVSGPWTWTAGLMAEGSERTWAGYPQRILGRNSDSTDTSPVLVAELYEGHEDEPPPNTTFIAHARTVVPLALAVVEAAQELMGDYSQQSLHVRRNPTGAHAIVCNWCGLRWPCPTSTLRDTLAAWEASDA